MCLYKHFVSVLYVFTLLMVLHVGAQKPDVTEGLNCTKGKDGKIIACQGKNAVLTESEKKINTYIKNNNEDFQTKMTSVTTKYGGGPAYEGGAPRPGTPQYCSPGGCKTTVSKIYTPSLLYNIHGEARFVLQIHAFNQAVMLVVCESENHWCEKTKSCEQKHFTYKLLVWDPYYPEGGLYAEDFDVPSGCCCPESHQYESHHTDEHLYKD